MIFNHFQGTFHLAIALMGGHNIPKRLDIAFFHHSLRLGSGIDTVIFEIANRISVRGANVTVYCFKSDYKQDQCRFRIREMRSLITDSTNRMMTIAPFVLDKFGKLKDELNKYDIINTHHYPANYISRNLDGPKKIVTEWSGAQPSMFSSFKEKLFLAWVLHANKVSARKSDVVLAPCEFVKEWITRTYELDAHVMYLDGINFDIFDKDRIKEQDFYSLHPHMHGKKIILFVGRITESKNIHLLIDSFTILKKRMPNVVLLLVGNYNSYRHYYNRLLDKLRLENLVKDVVFAGIVSWEDLPKYFAACSVYATCSAWEGFLRAEAFAFCKPIVCFNTGANMETVRDGYSGFVVENQNIKDFADKLRILLENEDLLKDYGENGYRWCKQVLDFDVISKNFQDFCTRMA